MPCACESMSTPSRSRIANFSLPSSVFRLTTYFVLPPLIWTILFYYALQPPFDASQPNGFANPLLCARGVLVYRTQPTPPIHARRLVTVILKMSNKVALAELLQLHTHYAL